MLSVPIPRSQVGHRLVGKRKSTEVAPPANDTDSELMKSGPSGAPRGPRNKAKLLGLLVSEHHTS